VGAVTSQRVLKVLFYVNILQCFFVVENFTAIGNRLIFEIWWNFFYDRFSIKNVADVNSIDSFVSKRNMEEFSVVIKTERDVTFKTIFAIALSVFCLYLLKIWTMVAYI